MENLNIELWQFHWGLFSILNSVLMFILGSQILQLMEVNWKLSEHNEFLAFFFVHSFAMLSTITNPILYGWLNTNLKHLFRHSTLNCIWIKRAESINFSKCQSLKDDRGMNFSMVQARNFNFRTWKRTRLEILSRPKAPKILQGTAK